MYYIVVILLYCCRELFVRVSGGLLIRINSRLAKLFSYFFVLTFLTKSL